MPPGSGSETPAGTLAGECWLAVQADSAATQTAAAAATTLTARMLIRRAATRPGCAGACPVPKPGLADLYNTWATLSAIAGGIFASARVGRSYAGAIPAAAGGMLAAIKAQRRSVEVGDDQWGQLVAVGSC